MLLIRLLTLLAALPLRLWVMGQRISGKITPNTAENRLGRATGAKPDAAIIWIHAASLGELSAVRPFLNHLVKQHADHQLLITTNNPAALDVAARWPDIPAILQAAPLDLPRSLNTFLDHWQPVAFVNIETEVWPNRFAALAKRGIRSVALNARLSDTSAKRFAKLGRAIGLHHFNAIFAQSDASAANFRALLGDDRLIESIPNFKSMVTLPATDPALVKRFNRADTVLAASTHPGEEANILSAFANAVSKHENLNLILAPRHPHRAAEIAKIAAETGLSPKTLDDPLDGNLFIVETLGQLPQLYALAAVTFVGGSLVPDVGGHTPYEPIRANSAIITGRFTENFAAEYTALDAAQGCKIASPETLGDAMITALALADEIAQSATQALPLPNNPEALLAKITADLGLTA